MQILPVGFHCHFARTFTQPYLLHGEWARFPGNFLAADGFVAFLSCIHHGILQWCCGHGSRDQSGSCCGGGRSHKLPAREIREAHHVLLILPIQSPESCAIMDIVCTAVDVWRVRKTVGWIKYSSVWR